MMTNAKRGEDKMLKGKTINLRTVRESDLRRIYDLECDIKNRGEYDIIGLLSEPIFRKDFHETGFWQDKNGTMVFTDKEDNIIGSISFFKSIPYFNGFEIGFAIYDLANRGKGYGSEAANIFVSYLFEVKEINRLQATTAAENIPSIRVLEKCGFKYEGSAREALFRNGEYKDAKIFSILRKESKRLKDLLE